MTGATPLTAMCGRSDVLAGLETVPQTNDLPSVDDDKNTSALMKAQKNIRRLFDIRQSIILNDARKAVSVCNSRRIRSGRARVLSSGMKADVFPPSEKLWQENFRYCSKIASRGIVEKGRRLFRRPLCWIRHSIGYELVTAPQSQTNSENDGSSADVVLTVQRIVESEKVMSTLDEHCEWMDELVSTVKRDVQNPELRIDREMSGWSCSVRIMMNL